MQKICMEQHFEAQQQFQMMQPRNASADSIAYISCKPNVNEDKIK